MSVLLIDSTQMATFAARGLLRVDALVPPTPNEHFLGDVGGSLRDRYRSDRTKAMRA